MTATAQLSSKETASSVPAFGEMLDHLQFGFLEKNNPSNPSLAVLIGALGLPRKGTGDDRKYIHWPLPWLPAQGSETLVISSAIRALGAPFVLMR